MELSTNKSIRISENFENIINIYGTCDFNLKKEYLKYVTSEKNQKKALPYLIRGLNNSDNKIRIWVINSLRLIKDPSTITLLISLYKNSNSIIRRNAMEALLEFSNPKAISIFIKALNDTDVGVRRYAAAGLGELKVNKAVIPLFTHLFDSDTRVRCNIIDALKSIDEIFAIIFSSDIFSKMFFMKNKFRTKKLVYEKILKYSSKLTQYPKINLEVQKWLEENKISSTIKELKTKIELCEFKLKDFRNSISVISEDWQTRLFEEEQMLEALLDFYRNTKTNFSLVRAEFDKSNPRIIYCTIEFKSNGMTIPVLINFEIRLPRKYPFTPPKACNFSSYEFIKKHHDYKRWCDEDPEFKGFRFACFGDLEKSWDKHGRMGIAHYIQMLCYYAAFDHFAVIL
ncbi:MAG: HEAT repeat domain-containing protein [Candidatus Helarchaeota archaeon]